jgi:zinc D-Ala-D-Ala carboxypeptidase
MPLSIRSLLAIVLTALTLAACMPMAMFASGSGAAYSGKKSDWGTYVASNEVNALCLSPKLRFLIWEFEGQFGRKVIMSSGYRDGRHNVRDRPRGYNRPVTFSGC